MDEKNIEVVMTISPDRRVCGVVIMCDKPMGVKDIELALTHYLSTDVPGEDLN